MSNIGALVPATLGATPFAGIATPIMTIATAVATGSQLVIAAATARITIMFHSPVPGADDMWVVPSTIVAVAGRGILLQAGSTVIMPSTCGWNAIATTGSQVLTIVEFF